MFGKLILLIILLFISTINKTKNYELKPKIIRYNKFKRKNISIKNIEENLIPFISYVKSIKEGNFPKISYNKRYSNPKVSFIASVFNKEKYLDSFISSMQMQDLQEIEIILVDDFSTDLSFKIINNFIKRDKRIKMIKNKKNMGTLYSRAIGGNLAKGNYFIFFDSDDIILKKGILKAYHHIAKYNLDIVQFLSIHQKNQTIYTTKYYYKYKNVIYQPILKYIFYCNSSGFENNVVLWDKLVKKKIVLKSLKYIGKKFIQNRIIIENDVILLYTIFKMAESYQFIESLGYYYFTTNQDSISNTWNNQEKSNEIIYSVLTNIKFLYEKSGNTFYDKYFCIFKVKQFFKRYKNILKCADKQFKFMKNIFNILLDSQIISNKDKLEIIKIYLSIFNIDGSIRE